MYPFSLISYWHYGTKKNLLTKTFRCSENILYLLYRALLRSELGYIAASITSRHDKSYTFLWNVLFALPKRNSQGTFNWMYEFNNYIHIVQAYIMSISHTRRVHKLCPDTRSILKVCCVYETVSHSQMESDRGTTCWGKCFRLKGRNNRSMEKIRR